MSWVREPLIHFLVLGAGLFLLYGMVAEPAPDASSIELSAGQVEQLAYGFQRTWQRPPSDEELEGLIEGRIREEIFYREALAMGLDRDDTIVRRRLRQKVEFLFEDIVAVVEPTEEDLVGYLEEHGESYRWPRRFSFHHVYLGRDPPAEDVARWLAKLETGVDPGTFGEPLRMLPGAFESEAEGEVTKLFGADFTERLAEISVGSWMGPLESGYGQHFVRVHQRGEGEVPDLDEIRDVVTRDWMADRRARSAQASYERIRQRYTVKVERPEEATRIAAVPR